MSSLRNAVKRVTHKERSQPVARQHLGILEKKKDYKERAVDYHRKEDRIKRLREKAALRNPDEFYFGMNNARVQEGQHKSILQSEGFRDLDPETIALMKSQDLSYVRMQKQKDSKKAERLQASLHLLDADSSDTKSSRKHTVFVESVEEALHFDVAEHFDTLPELMQRSYNRLRRSDIENLVKGRMAGNDVGEDEDDDSVQPLSEEQMKQQAKLERKAARKLAKLRASSYRELEARQQRAKAMERVEDHLVTEKLMTSKGRKRKIKAAEGGKPAQFKWRRKRLG